MRLKIVIDGEGRVGEAAVVHSIPPLDQAALDAVRQWPFTPTLLNGRPVRVAAVGEVLFTLDE